MKGVDKSHLGQRVRAHFASRGLDGRFEVAWEGQMLGYTDYPTAMIQLADGKQVHWVAYLCEAVEESLTLDEAHG
jgi:hypothetical protein